MKTATRTKPKSNGHAGDYHDVNKHALKRVDALMSGKPDPALMTLEDDEGSATAVSAVPRLNGAKHGSQSRGTAADDAHLAAIHARELIPIEHLAPSPCQPRKDFSSEKLDELAASLKAEGINHTDLIVRLTPGSAMVGNALKAKKSAQYEILAGERRWRAAAIAKLPALWCVVVELDNAAARRLCRQENLQREDLTDIERVTAYRDMLRDGDYPTQQALAESLGITPATLSNQLRVLDLPREWLDLVSQEKLTLTHLRSLATWVGKPDVLAALKANILGDDPDCMDWEYDVGFGKKHARLPTVKEFDAAVLDAVHDASRPVDAIKYSEVAKGFDGKRITIMPEDLPLPSSIKADNGTLDVIDVKGLGRRAFNIDVWNALSAHAKAHRAKKASGGRQSPESDDKDLGGLTSSARQKKTPKQSASEQRRRAEQAVKRHQRDLYTFRIEWLQAKISERLNDAPLQVLVWHLLALAAGIRRPSSDHTTESWLSDQFGEAAIAAGGSQKGKHHSTDEWKTLKTLMKGDKLGVDSGDVKSDPTAILRETLTRWYAVDLKRWARPFDEDFIEAAADDLGIDFAKEWRLDRTFLELFSKEQLGELWAEWKLPLKTMSEHMKRPAIINAVINHFDAANAKLRPNCPLPKCLAKLKPCQITR